jgi:AraC-like DNA-binding protein
MWDGNSYFGRGWALYRGPVEDHFPHAHAAVQIALASEDALKVEVDASATIEGDVLVIGPMITHRLLASRAPAALLYVDLALPFAQTALASICPHRIARAPEEMARILRDTRGEAVRLQHIVEQGRTSIDARLERAIEEATRSGGSGNITQAVRNNGLSPQRARYLARQQLGAPIKTVLLWRKLELAARAIAGGNNLASAAASAGFSDQAHLSRTMKHMFGVTPGEAAHPLRRPS